ncbi:MAG: ComF family protein [Chloroflexota bacterium]|nr:ComF family protein [Chloroflexota bacterium]MDE2898450.1 ComF family protein [Chloroflexota bacterium]
MAKLAPPERIQGGAVLCGSAKSAAASLGTATRALAAALFPPRCAACGRPGAALCQSCLATATLLSHPQCRQCTRPLTYGDQCARCRLEQRRIDHLYVPYAYTPPILNAVHRFKYANKRYLAADLAALAMSALPPDLQVDFVVPVPLAPSRERQRGYNQARLLAAEVARRLDLQLDTGLLIRLRDTPPQTSLPRARRLQNVRGAFRALRKLSGARILLVDDVTTTGATIEAATRALRRRGAVWIGALALARTPEERSDVPPNPAGLLL